MVHSLTLRDLNKVTVYIEDAELTKEEALYPWLLLELFSKRECRRSVRGQQESGELKDKFVRLFGDHWASGLFLVKLHLLDHLCHSLEIFHSIQLFDPDIYKYLCSVFNNCTLDFLFGK